MAENPVNQTVPGVAVPAATNIDPNASRSLPTAGPQPQRPLRVASDPKNPGQLIWVDAQTGEPAVQPGGPGTAFVSPQDPSAQPKPTPTSAAPTQPPVVPGVGDLPGQATAILQDSTDQLSAAQTGVQDLWQQIAQQRTLVDSIQSGGIAGDPTGVKLQQATSNLNALYSSLSAALSRVESANAAKATAAQKVLDSVQLTPAQADYYRAQSNKAGSDGALAAAQAKVLVDGSEGQKALTAAQAGLANAQASVADINAKIAQAKSPAEIQQLQAQASALQAQANSTTQLLPGLIAKQAAETGLTQAQTDLTGANSDLVRAQTVKTGADTTLAQAQAQLAGAQATQLTPAEAANQASQAALNTANIQKGLLGPTYGLQDQINAIRAVQAQVFGPGGSGDPAHANDLLNQYLSSTLGGTTPYAASVAAANAGQNIYTTQAALANQAAQSAASRANALAGVGGNVFSTLAGMNANAPAGSTAMVGAFQDVLGAIQGAMNAPGFAAPGQPAAPQLPAFLQQFAGGAQPGAQAAMAPMVTPGAAGMPPAASPVVAPQPAPQAGQPITINIGGQPQPMPFAQSGLPEGRGAAPVTPVAPAQPTLNPPFAQSGLPEGRGNTGAANPQALPNYLQGMASPTMDFLHQLWGKELGAGTVQSPSMAGI